MFFISFQVWPQAVLVVPFLAGMLVTLKYLLFGSHRIVLSIHWASKGVGAGFAQLLSRSKEVEPARREKYCDSPEPTTDIEKYKVIEDEEKEDKKKAR